MVFRKGNIPWNKGIHGQIQSIEDRRRVQQKWYHNTKNERKNHKKQYIERVKLEVYSNYSPTLSCKCCGESEYEFLTIDHMNGRTKEDDHGGWNLVNWIKRNNFPNGFQILCFNCNSGKEKHNMNGICPHELKQNNDWEWEL